MSRSLMIAVVVVAVVVVLGAGLFVYRGRVFRTLAPSAPRARATPTLSVPAVSTPTP
jgi:hypothetical protein